ncbi:hypothetical protein F4777DRAFT_596545, partial [Nemania sp. FL0916]
FILIYSFFFLPFPLFPFFPFSLSLFHRSPPDNIRFIAVCVLKIIRLPGITRGPCYFQASSKLSASEESFICLAFIMDNTQILDRLDFISLELGKLQQQFKDGFDQQQVQFDQQQVLIDQQQVQLDQQQVQLDQQQVQLDQQYNVIVQGFNRVGQRLDALDKSLGQRFTSLDQRLTSLDQGIKNIKDSVEPFNNVIMIGDTVARVL